MQKILDIELNALKDRLKEQGYSLRISNMVKKQLLNKSNSYKYGARPIRRSVQTYIEDIITDKMLSNPQHKYLTISNI